MDRVQRAKPDMRIATRCVLSAGDEVQSIGRRDDDKIGIVGGGDDLSWTLSIEMWLTGITQRFREAFEQLRREFFSVYLVV
jgi:hypothetical protein